MWEWLEGLAQHPVIAALSVIGGALGIITLVISFMRGTIKIPVKAWVFLHGKPYERKEVNAFEIIHEQNKLLPRLYGEAPSGTLGDLDMPYTRRNPEKDLQTELLEKLNAHKRILLLAPSGYGKTREAGKLVESMIARGYRAILVHSKGWLDVPQHWPDGLPNNQIVIVLDDLNRLIPSSPTVQMERETCDPAVRLPSYEQRLVRFVRYFEDGASNVCVIATARDKQELLARTKDRLWEKFEEVNLEQFTPDAMCELLEAATGKAGVEAKPEIVERCIQKSERNPRVIKNNLQRCKQEGKQLDDKDYEPTLDGSWNARYQSLIKRYPEVHCIYNAIYLLQSAGVVLEIERVKAVALMLVQGRLQRIWMRLPIQRALRFLQQRGEINLTTYNNQKVFVPADGQIIPSSADLTCKCKSASGTNTANGYPSSEKEILELYVDRLVHLFRRRGDLQALKQLGLKAVSAGLMQKALDAFDRALAIDPQDAEAHSYRGVALAQLGRMHEALAAFDEALKINPQFAEAHYNRGVALTELGRTDEALAAFDRALAINPQDAKAHHNRGAVLAKLGRTDEALVAFDRALAINPQDAEAHQNRGAVLTQLRRMNEALVAFDEALKINPQFAEAHYNRGLALAQLGRTDEARAAFDCALAAFDRALAINLQDAKAHHSRGLALTQLGRMHEALAAFDEALKINPQFAEAHNYRGLALAKLRRMDEALAAFDRALAINPQDAEAHHGRGVALAQLGRTDEALAAFDHALAINPQDAEAHHGRGLALARLGRTDEALAAFDRALAINPQDARTHYNRGVALTELGRTDEALAAFDEALKINPQFAEVHYSRGVVLTQLRRMDEALADFDEALKINPQFAEVHYSRGLVLAQLGRMDEALAAFDEALKINPQFAEAHYWRWLNSDA